LSSPEASELPFCVLEHWRELASPLWYWPIAPAAVGLFYGSSRTITESVPKFWHTMCDVLYLWNTVTNHVLFEGARNG
jgi:hypothetical protein